MKVIGKYIDDQVKFDIQLSDDHVIPFDLLYDELCHKMTFDLIGNYNKDICFSDISFTFPNLNYTIEPYVKYLETLGSVKFRGYGSYLIMDYGLYKFNIRNDQIELKEISDNLDYYKREFILENLP